MGSSPSKGASKGASNKIEPVLSRSESWSTLDGFVACETGMDKQEALAVNTTVNDKEIKQVKTWMDFPGRKPKSTLNLDVHLSQSVHRKKHQNSPHEEDHSAIFYSQGLHYCTKTTTESIRPCSYSPGILEFDPQTNYNKVPIQKSVFYNKHRREYH